MGRGYIRDGGKALFFTVRPVDRSVAIRTASCTYLLAPRDRAGFIATLEGRRLQANAARAPSQALACGDSGPTLRDHPLGVGRTGRVCSLMVSSLGGIRRCPLRCPSISRLRVCLTPGGRLPQFSCCQNSGALALLADVAIAALSSASSPDDNVRSSLHCATRAGVRVGSVPAFAPLVPPRQICQSQDDSPKLSLPGETLAAEKPSGGTAQPGHASSLQCRSSF